jgi:hypothetical protein
MGRFVRLVAKVLGPNAPERPRWKRKRIRAPKRKTVQAQAQASAEVLPSPAQVRGRLTDYARREAAEEVAPLIIPLLQAFTPHAMALHYAMKTYPKD